MIGTVKRCRLGEKTSDILLSSDSTLFMPVEVQVFLVAQFTYYRTRLDNGRYPTANEYLTTNMRRINRRNVHLEESGRSEPRQTDHEDQRIQL